MTEPTRGEPDDGGLPGPDRSAHGKMPDLDDDAPPKEADLAQRGLVEETPADDGSP
jgi:hypothetical protein